MPSVASLTLLMQFLVLVLSLLLLPSSPLLLRAVPSLSTARLPGRAKGTIYRQNVTLMNNETISVIEQSITSFLPCALCLLALQISSYNCVRKRKQISTTPLPQQTKQTSKHNHKPSHQYQHILLVGFLSLQRPLSFLATEEPRHTGVVEAHHGGQCG